MSIKARTAAVIAGALTATAVTGIAAFASPLTGATTGAMDGQPMHMDQMNEAMVGDMADLMAEGATVGEMHQWMADNGMPIGAMHGEMAAGGSNPGTMHRSMAAPTR